MKDVNKKMSKTQALNDIFMLFSLFHKQNVYDTNDYPFIYNFVTFGKWFCFIKKSKRGKYQVSGRVPWYVEFKPYSNKFYDVFSEYDDYKKAKDDFYIIVQKLSYSEYVV